MQKSILYFGAFLLALSSCVTPKIYNAVVAEHEATKTALNTQEKRTLKLQTEVEELQGTVAFLKSQLFDLRDDSIQNGGALVALQNKYSQLSDSYDLLTSKNSRYMAEKAKETESDGNDHSFHGS